MAYYGMAHFFFPIFHFLKIVNLVKIVAKILFLARCKFMITLLRLLKLEENFSHTHTRTRSNQVSYSIVSRSIWYK